MVGGRASRSTTPSKQFIIHARQVANRAYNWQTFPVLGKSKLSRQRMKHPSPAAIGVPQSKKHTDVTESTDLSFSRIFLINSIDLCVLSIPLIMWWFNGFWASSFLAQDFNASMTPLASESVSITTQWNNRVKKIREKTNPCHQRNPCVFLTLTPIAKAMCAPSAQFWLSRHWESLPIVRSACCLHRMNYELFGWCCRAGRSTSYRQSLTPNS